MISPDQIEKVRTAVDIVEVVKEYVPTLKASGRTVKGLCPFHSERTPSFHVHPEKRIFKCFGCGESGDVISFLSKVESVGFTDALKRLADQAGIRLETTSSRVEKDPPNTRDRLYRILEAARSFYEDKLWDERLGAAARAYLEKRGVREETARDFHLGCVPTTGGAAFEALVQKGFSVDLCHQAGLVSRSAAGRLYDPLFGRLVFPISDSFGHVIGFGGRVLPNQKSAIPGLSNEETKDEGPSYLNSPESPVFKKGESLYGLTRAKGALLEKRQAVILEGYMDVIGLHQAGVTNAVATLGTAFTNAHAKLLKRYVTETVAFFDPDEAGQRAAHRSLGPILEEDLFPRIVRVEEEQDPDEIVLAKGREHLEGMIQRSPDFVDWLLSAAHGPGGLTLQKKSEAAKEILKIISQSPNEILKAEWIHRVSVSLGLQEESLTRESIRQGRPQPAAMARAERPAPSGARALPSAEDECLSLLMTSPELWNEAEIEIQDFQGEPQRRLFGVLREAVSASEAAAVTEIADRLPPEDRGWLLSLSMEDREYQDRAERIQQLARGLRKARDGKRLEFLSKKLKVESGTPEEWDELKSLRRRVQGSPVEIS